ncbi:MAG: FMN-binding protein, partial [Acidobacteria bacterium]|nr:FMN-binding protein [Acidobacteriota bacterium]
RPAVRLLAAGRLLGATAAAAAQPGISREEALAAVFPGAAIDADRVYLTEDQRDAVAALSRQEVPGRIYARYVARRGGGGAVVGRAYVDTHVVRTKRESLLISVDPRGRVLRIDVTAFLEPPEYVAPEPWLRQYDRRPLDDDLAIQRAIRPIAGATLTNRAVNGAVRRVLALDRVLQAGAQQP